MFGCAEKYTLRTAHCAVGWGDFSFTKTAVTQKRKVEKSILRCEMDRLTEDYKRAVDKICGRTAKNGFLGQNRVFGPKKSSLLGANHVLATAGKS